MENGMGSFEKQTRKGDSTEEKQKQKCEREKNRSMIRRWSDINVLESLTHLHPGCWHSPSLLLRGALKQRKETQEMKWRKRGETKSLQKQSKFKPNQNSLINAFCPCTYSNISLPAGWVDSHTFTPVSALEQPSALLQSPHCNNIKRSRRREKSKKTKKSRRK